VSTSKYRVTHEEQWEPWEIVPDDGVRRHWRGDLPEDLVERFQKAKTEMESVWDELRNYMREDE
jgi:hypothetical protein